MTIIFYWKITSKIRQIQRTILLTFLLPYDIIICIIIVIMYIGSPDRTRHIRYFESLHIKHPEHVYRESFKNYSIYKIFNKRNVLNYQLQKDSEGFTARVNPEAVGTRDSEGFTGGGKTKTKSLLADDISNIRTINYKFEGIEFILYEGMTIDGGRDISVHRKSDIDNPEHCLHIITHPNNGIVPPDEAGDAILQSINYHSNCAVNVRLQNPGGGTILLKMAIQFLKEFKKVYQIERIILQDNSVKICPLNGAEVELGLLHTLRYGHTWYGGRYGFMPYDHTTKSLDLIRFEAYKKNHYIVKNTKVKDTPLIYYMESIYKDNMTKEKAKEKAKRLYQRTKNMTICEFFNSELSDFNTDCHIISSIYKGFSKNIKLHSFFETSFFLEI